MPSKGTLHKIDDFYYQCGGITDNHIKDVDNLDNYDMGSSLNDWGCDKYNPSLQIINLKTKYKNGIVNEYYVVEPNKVNDLNKPLKQYTFYLDISDELADRYRNKYIRHPRDTSRNWARKHVIKNKDLLCFGENSIGNYSPQRNPGKNWLFNPPRDDYINDDDTFWGEANEDFYKNKGKQLSQYFSGPKVAKDLKVTASRSCGIWNDKGTPCVYSVLGKDGKKNEWQEGSKWSNLGKSDNKYFTSYFDNRYNYDCKGYGKNCMRGSNKTDATDYFTRYTYPCLTPRAYVDPPKLQNNLWQAPALDSDSIYYRGPNNEFNVVLETKFRRLDTNTPNPPEIKTDTNTLILFTVTYYVDWSNPDINGYKLLDLLDFVSLFDSGMNTEVRNNKTVRENNKQQAREMVEDFCNEKGEMGNPICSADDVLDSRYPSIISDPPPCYDYGPCKKGWNKYCNNSGTYNNQNCIQFYNNIVGKSERGLVDTELETTLTEVCSNMYNDGNENIDLNVCGCFLKETSVYDDIKEAAKLPNFLDFGTPKCWYGPCVSSPYQNSAGECTDVTYTQCIQNSYANIEGGGNISKSQNSVTQVIDSCGPSTENDSDKVPEPEPVPQDEEDEDAEEEKEEEKEEVTTVNSISKFVKDNIVVVILVFVVLTIGGVVLGIM